MNLISLTFEALFVLLIIINASITNRSIDRLERKISELEEKEVPKELEQLKEEVKTVIKKKRTRKPRVVKEAI